MVKLLQSVYSDQSWENYRFSKPHQVEKNKKFYSKTQQLLYQVVKSVSKIKFSLLWEIIGNDIQFNQIIELQRRSIELDVSNCNE